MTLTKVLIDTNVCLDALLNRKPFMMPALQLIEYSQQNNFQGMVSAHSFDTLFYLLNKKLTQEKTYKGIKTLRKSYNVLPVTEQIIDFALNAGWNDFEDAIHYAVAQAANCDAIITRNQKDFKDADMPVLSPLELLDRLNEH